MCQNVGSYFRRTFSFQCSGKWRLPSADQLFHSAPFLLDEMQEMKKNLNATKSKLDDIELTSWHQHTRQTNPAGDVTRHLRHTVNAELCTQAWAKFQEIVATYKLVPDQARAMCILNTVHLCEAPGAFVTSLNHYVKSHCIGLEWQWVATTLNPFYEGNSPDATVTDDQFILETLDKWDFGRDNSGDVMKWTNVESLCERVGSCSVLLVTADGSVDCQDVPAEQESHVAPLQYCETVTALTLLDRGGSFLIKMFTMFEHQTICLVYLLCCAFEQVNVMKPATSKGGNSEVYVACMGYRGRDVVTSEHLLFLQEAIGAAGGSSTTAMFPRSMMPADALRQIEECARKFMSWQIEAIERNLRLYDSMTKNSMTKKQRKELQAIKRNVVSLYMEKYHVKRIEPEQRIVMKQFQAKTCSHSVWSDTSKRLHSGSYSQRQKRKAESWQDRVRGCEAAGNFASQGAKQTHFVEKCDEMQDRDSVRHSVSDISDMLTDWLENSGDGLCLSHIQPVSGATVSNILSSPFCGRQLLSDYMDATCNAKVLCSENIDAACKRFCAVCPFYAFRVRPVPYFLSSDGLDLATINCFSKLVGKGTFPVVDGRLKETSRSFLDLSGRPGGYTSYLRWMFPKAKIHVVDYEATSHMGECHDSSRCEDSSTCQIHRLSSVDTIGVNRVCETVVSSSGQVNVVVGDAGCVGVADCLAHGNEIHTRHALLSHCIIAFKVLRLGGSFICRLFDSFTRVTAAVLFILHKVFDKICIVKPRTSCPVAADRFVVCKGFQNCDAEVTEKLLAISNQMVNSPSSQSVLEIVPVSQLLEEPFCQFLTTCNESMSKRITDTLIQMEHQLLQPEENMGDTASASEAICSLVLDLLGLPVVA